jgi:hypothetical protein
VGKGALCAVPTISDPKKNGGHAIGPRVGAVRWLCPPYGTEHALQVDPLGTTALDGHMILLHGFIKKTQKTPPADIALGLQQKKEVT